MVFIYYANETSPKGDEEFAYKTMESWLRESREPDLVKFSNRLKQDRELFAKTVDRELSEFTSALAKGSLSIPIVLVTNRLAKSQKAWLLSPGEKQIREISISASKNNLPVLAENPTSSREFFELFLHKVRDLYPVEQNDFILLTKSHGNSEMAMMPFVRLWPNEIDKEKFLELARNSLLSKKDANYQLPLNAHLRGISKSDYKRVLDRSKMSFNFVVMESCFGGPSADIGVASVALPQNVDRLYGAGDHGVPYENIQYLKLFQSKSSAQFEQDFEIQLSDKFSVEKRRFNLHKLLR